jgi:hypothetical protein
MLRFVRDPEIGEQEGCGQNYGLGVRGKRPAMRVGAIRKRLVRIRQLICEGVSGDCAESDDSLVSFFQRRSPDMARDLVRTI